MLKTVLETLDGVDDAVKSYYTEIDGKFVLQIEGVDAHPDVVNLKTAYERVKADKSKAAEERDALKAKVSALPEDFDPEKWAKLKDGKPDEAALIKVREALEAERDEWRGKYEATITTMQRNAVDRDLTDALNAAGVNNPTFVKAARTLLSGAVKIGEDGKPFVETDMGPQALSEHVKRWAAGEGKDFVTPPQGGGAKGGQGGAKGGNTLIEKVPALADLPEK